MAVSREKKVVKYPEQKEHIFVTKDIILEYGQNAVGKLAGDFDKDGRLRDAGNKGRVGHTIEEGIYGYHINSESEPDFPEAGVELKSTGVLRNKNNEYTAKERLVLNIINYMKEAGASFDTSSFWHKNQCLMLIVYEYLKGRPYVDFPIVAAELFTYPVEDLYIIRDDWAKIVGKIRAGKAHELSEGDTLYLGACTKGSKGGNPRPQPFSDVLAKQRAYCLKQSYMNYVIQTHIFHEKAEERIVYDVQKIKDKSFEEYIIEKLDTYKGKSVRELVDELGIVFKVKDGKKVIPKNLDSLVAFRMFGVKGNKAEELEKAGVVVKIIHLNTKGTNKESVSFPAFDFQELIAEDNWEESDFCERLQGTRYLFVVFRGTKMDARLLGGQFWTFPNSDLNDARLVWEHMRKILQEDCLEVNIKGGTVYNNLPKSSQNRVAHVRPHGLDRDDRCLLPEGTQVHIMSTDGTVDCPVNSFTKQCFWLNKKYVLSQLDARFKR